MCTITPTPLIFLHEWRRHRKYRCDLSLVIKIMKVLNYFFIFPKFSTIYIILLLKKITHFFKTFSLFIGQTFLSPCNFAGTVLGAGSYQ